MKRFKNWLVGVFILLLGAVNMQAADMCYDPPQTSGGLPFIGCPDMLGINCTTTTPIRNISSSTITNTTVIHAFEGLNFDLGNKIGIDGVEKTVNLDGDQAEFSGTLNSYTNLNGFVDFNIFDKGIVYRTGDYAPSSSTSTTDQHNIYIYNLVSIGFSAEKYLATYTKDGTVYNTRIYPCGQKLVSITPQNQSIAEGDVGTTAANFTVTLSSTPTVNKLYVSYTITPQTATQGTDYSAPSYSGTLTFNKNTPTLSQTISTSVIGDDINESNETYVVSLTSLSQAASENFIIDESFQKGTVTIIDDDNGSGGSGGVDEGMGNGDFIDTSITTPALSSAYNASADTSSFGLKFIKTKIASQTTSLTAVYLNDFGISADYDNNASGDVDSKLWFAIPVLNDLDATGGCPSANSSLLQQIIDPTTNKQVIFTVKDLGTADYSQTKNVVIPSNASKNAKIEMILVDTSKLSEDAQNCVEVSSQTGNLEGLGQCVNSEVQYVDAYGQTAYDRCAVNSTYGQPCLPQNNGVGTGLFNSALGCFMCTFYAGTACSSDNFAIRPDHFDNNLTLGQTLRADENTSISFHANRDGGIGTLNYDESETQTTPSFVIDANISNPTTKSCQQPSMNFTPRITFADGNVTGNFSLPNVGDLNVTMHEIVGSEFALVDADDTTDPAVRLITPHTQQIKVIPHHFEIDGNLTNGSNGFTYLSNFEQNPNDADRNISASLDINVTAQAENNATTSNYTAECYAKNGNVILGLANPIAPDPTGSLTKLLWYHYTPNANGSVPLNTMALQYDIPFSSTQFDSNDTNGTAEFSYKINFDRNVTKVVNPFVVTVADINATDDDGVAGNNPLDSNATFVYGRVIARDVRIFGQKPFIANAWHEAFSQTPLTIGTTALAPSRTDTNWYIMAPHSDAVDGNANVTHMQTNGAVATGAPLFDTVTYVSGIETYEENTGWPLNRYKAHILTAPWLWYGVNALDYADPATGDDENACLTHPCFNINVVPAVGATGSAKEDAADNKANKRTNKNTTGWKSTSDYAPAVR